MGTIRTILALSVVFFHTYGFVFVGGHLAVRLFYIISGFLMSYILTETGLYSDTSRFYVNRFLRLFPLYWLVALGTLFIWLTVYALPEHEAFINVYRNIDLVGFVSLVLSNIFLFGQDWIMFTGVRNGTFQFLSNFWVSEIAFWQGLLVPQAWTLGVELSFYLIAPFVLRRRTLIYALLCASILLRVYIIKIGLGFSDPWSYRFFPTELAFFLLGALSHQILRPLYTRLLSDRLPLVSIVVTAAMIIYCLMFFKLPFRPANAILLLGMFILAIPLLFEFQAKWKFDARVGNLSYPIYISHVTLISPTELVLRKLYDGPEFRLAAACSVAIVTLCVSYLLERFVSERIEVLRKRVKTGWGRRRPARADMIASPVGEIS
jgi:peptidoglycan/LPS O-acetylase OafA/YrhL